MPTLRKTAPTSDPTVLYTPITAYGTADHEVFKPELDKLPGDHPAVLRHPDRWIRADASSVEKGAARRARWEAGMASMPESPPDPLAPRILGPIPQERRRIATRNYHDRAGRIIHEGQVYDANDPFVKANPDMFRPEEVEQATAAPGERRHR